MKHLITKLKTVTEEQPNSIQADISRDVLQYSAVKQSVLSFFDTLELEGCEMGLVDHILCEEGALNFYDKHSEEIEDMKESNKILRRFNTDDISAKVSLVWYAYEEKAKELAISLGIKSTVIYYEQH